MTRRDVMKTLAATASLPAAAIQSDGLKIRHIDIIHHTHTDFGFTDMPSVCRDLQVRFLDAALQTCLDDKRFHWTIEGTVALDDWWRGAPAQRKSDLLRMVKSGQMDVMALPFNQTPFQNAMQWGQMLSWLPPDVWKALEPRAAMQSDVNGFPRGYEAQICNHGDGYTGWLWKPGAPTGKATELLTKDGEWFSYRIRAAGTHIQFWINDKLVMTYDDPEYKTGHFAIQGHNPGMKVEARELYYLDLNK